MMKGGRVLRSPDRERGWAGGACTSVSFDRAVDYYDRTRALDPAIAAAQTGCSPSSCAAAPGPALEIGVGTGRIALPLAARGRRVVGVDLSAGMLAGCGRRTRRRASRWCVGDATRAAVPRDTFGAAIACHVLHLVADWVAVVGRAAQGPAAGGMLLVSRGAAGPG